MLTFLHKYPYTQREDKILIQPKEIQNGSLRNADTFECEFQII